MTLEHQTRMTNLMIRIGWDARIAQQEKKLDAAARTRINEEIDEMVKYMLFADEEPLHAPVKGVSTFTQTISATRSSRPSGPRPAGLRSKDSPIPLSPFLHDL